MSESTVTDEELAAIEARAEVATPGPWTTDGGHIVETEEPLGDGSYDGDCVDVCEVFHYGCGGSLLHDHTAEFIAHAREDVPRLVAALRAATAELVRLRKIEKAARWLAIGAMDPETSPVVGSQLVADLVGAFGLEVPAAFGEAE